MISTSGQEQQKKKDMAELLSEIVARNGNDSGNGGKNIIAIQFLCFLIGSNPPALIFFITS